MNNLVKMVIESYIQMKLFLSLPTTKHKCIFKINEGSTPHKLTKTRGKSEYKLNILR